MSKRLGIIVVALIIILGTSSLAGAQTLTEPQRHAWQNVEERWQAWQKGDFEKMLALHHPRFHRWSGAKPKLEARDELLARWQRVRKLETVISYTLEPVAIDLYGDYAAIHYISRETVWLEPEAPPVLEGRIKAGQTHVTAIRWSDYLVKEKGHWLYIGGARDDTCSISDRAQFPCRTN